MAVESCWRCAAQMEWRHGTWQCPRCRFKLGCCEGEPQSACDAPDPSDGPAAAPVPGALAGQPADGSLRPRA